MIQNISKIYKIENNRIKVDEKTSLLFMGSFVALIIIRDVYSVPIPSNIFTFLALFIFVVYDISTMLAFLAFLIPFTTGIPGSFITMCALFVFILKIKYININIGVMSVWIIACIELYNMIGTRNSFGLYLRIIIFLIFIVLVLTNNSEKYNYDKIVKLYIYGYFWACVDIILQTLKEFSLTQFINSGIRFGRTLNYVETTIEGKLVSPNVNSLGIYSLMVIAFILVVTAIDKKYYTLLPFLVFATFVGILTYSRTFIVTLIILVFFYLIILCRIKKNIGKTLFKVVGSMIIIFFVVFNNFSSVIQNTVSRFQVEDVSSGRIDIASYYTNFLLNHPKALVLGVGLQDYKVKANYFMSAHNGVQEILIAWGLVGFVCVTLLFYSIFKVAKRDAKSKNQYLLSVVPTLVFIISLQASRLFSAGFLINMAIPCYCIIRLAIQSDNYDRE